MYCLLVPPPKTVSETPHRLEHCTYYSIYEILLDNSGTNYEIACTLSCVEPLEDYGWTGMGHCLIHKFVNLFSLPPVFVNKQAHTCMAT